MFESIQLINLLKKQSKAFNLLKKLKFYHIDNQTIYIGLPSGLHHGSSVFYWINDIIENVSSQLKLFADDCLLYQVITIQEDSVAPSEGFGHACLLG